MIEFIADFYNHPDTKTRIFHIAANLFSEKGYHQVSIREICEIAKISKPTLYYYFENKRTLFLTLLEETDRISEELINEFIDTEKGYVNKFHGLFRLHSVFLKRYPYFVKFFFVIHFMSLENGLKEKVSKQTRKKIQRLQAFIEKGQAEKYIAPDIDPFILSISIFGSIRYLMLYHLKKLDSEFEIEKQLEQLFHFWKHNIFVKEN